MNEQTEMPLFAGKPLKKNVTWLEDLLKNRCDWMTAAEILQTLCMKDTDDNKRYVRQMAHASSLVLSGPGSPGYKYLGHSTPQEIEHYTNAGISQGKEMVKRGMKLRRAAHKIFG